MAALARLLATHAGAGRVTWIGLRPARLAEPVAVGEAYITEAGLERDHARAGSRALTLIQAEHLPVIAALSRRRDVVPELLRRNLVIEGINLTALRHATLIIGEAEIRISGPCPPCSRMEKALGRGGYNAMRGHGGWYAEVIRSGRVRIGDAVSAQGAEPPGV